MSWPSLHGQPGNSRSSQTTETRLFCTVYQIDQALSLRLGRPLSFHCQPDLLSANSQVQILSRLRKFQAHVDNRLLTPIGSLHSSSEGQIVEIAQELQYVVRQSQAEHLNSAIVFGPVEVLCVQTELACQSLLLSHVLDSVTHAGGHSENVMNILMAIARSILEVHQQYLEQIHGQQPASLAQTQYPNWHTWHIPVAAFSALFTQAVSTFDPSDVNRLASFASSMKAMDKISGEIENRPSRLYHLLARAAKLHVEAGLASTLVAEDFLQSLGEGAGEFDFTSTGF